MHFIVKNSLCINIYTHVTKIGMLPNVCHYITEMEVVQEEEEEEEVVEEGEE